VRGTNGFFGTPGLEHQEGDVQMHLTGHAGAALAASRSGQARTGHALSRLAMAFMLALAMLASMASFSAQDASAGQIGYINTEGAPLMVHPTNHSVMDWMHNGAPVDVLYGPHDGMYEVRYYGVDGWVWAEYLDIGGSTASVGGGGSSSSYAAPAKAERWIDVNRTTGLVSLMVGDSPQWQFWGSMGWDQSADGFYATAIGTYYIYGFDYSLHYTPYADNYISHWVAFDPERFNGFHSYTKDAWGNIVPNGGGLTGGCVALAPGDIDILYDFAEMGMRVEVHF
jgi:hypothetical protein